MFRQIFGYFNRLWWDYQAIRVVKSGLKGMIGTTLPRDSEEYVRELREHTYVADTPTFRPASLR